MCALHQKQHVESPVLLVCDKQDARFLLLCAHVNSSVASTSFFRKWLTTWTYSHPPPPYQFPWQLVQKSTLGKTIACQLTSQTTEQGVTFYWAWIWLVFRTLSKNTVFGHERKEVSTRVLLRVDFLDLCVEGVGVVCSWWSCWVSRRQKETLPPSLDRQPGFSPSKMES